jgi:hypothetical protein
MKNINWNNVPDQQEFKKLAPGGYTAMIVTAVDVPEKEYLKIEYDIAEGEFANHYQGLYEAKNFWGGSFIRSYKEKAQSMFKGFLTAIKNSNSNFIFKNDEKQLVGKLVGVVLGEEEYRKNDQSIGKRLYVHSTRSIEEIKKGVDIPEFKKLKLEVNGYDVRSFGTEVFPEEEIPF